jgi:proline dehydrogenase
MSVDRAVLFRLATSPGLERAVRAAPGGEGLAWRGAAHYVAGRAFDDARRVSEELHGRGAASSIDQFGELVDDPELAADVGADYRRHGAALSGLAEDTWLSIDLSHLGLDIDPSGCADQLALIAQALPNGRRIQVGAEDHARADAVLRCVLDVAGRGLADRLGATAQANLFRTPDDVEKLIAAGVHVRLVKGAYLEPPERALPYGEPTDIAYLRLAHRLAAAGGPFALATHDGVLREALLAALGAVSVEQLLGVRPDVVDDLISRKVPVRVYVPFGDGWFRYWMRRLAESRGS